MSRVWIFSPGRVCCCIRSGVVVQDLLFIFGNLFLNVHCQSDFMIAGISGSMSSSVHARGFYANRNGSMMQCNYCH